MMRHHDWKQHEDTCCQHYVTDDLSFRFHDSSCKSTNYTGMYRFYFKINLMPAVSSPNQSRLNLKTRFFASMRPVWKNKQRFFLPWKPVGRINGVFCNKQGRLEGSKRITGYKQGRLKGKTMFFATFLHKTGCNPKFFPTFMAEIEPKTLFPVVSHTEKTPKTAYPARFQRKTTWKRCVSYTPDPHIHLYFKQ